MKLFGTVLLASLSFLNSPAAEQAKAIDATDVVVISTDYINRLVAEARTNSPALKAADSRVRSAMLNAQAVRTWEDPMAMFGGSVYSARGFDPAEDGNLAYGVEQKLPLWGRPKLSRRLAEAETSTREAEVNYRAHQLRSEITKVLMLTALAETVVEVGEQDLAWLEATAKATDNKYRAGQAVVADTLQIQNEVAKRNDTLRTDHRRLAHEHFTLNRLLNRDAGSRWPTLKLPSVAPAIPLSDKLLTLALQNEPKLKVLEQEIKQAGASAALTRKLRLPEVSLGVEGRQYTGDGDFRSGMFSLRFSLPWANGGSYRKEYERDKEKQKSAEQEREDQILMVREELHHLAVGIEAMRRESLLHTGEITTRAGQALASRLADWEAGRGAFRDVLDARRMLLESQLMSARATAEQHQMLAEMLRWTGLENLEALTPLAAESPLLPDHETRATKP
ncbi:MAG TPA: TolC family protein [Verrucomicrobiae bacterium]|nr:TolC family protein [Verrucomicrobiae bacterium]